MKRTLQGSKSKKTPLPNIPNMENAGSILENADPAQINEIQNIMEHYGAKSESELMGELRQARQAGTIDPNELASVAQKLAPMLTPEQQQRLFYVMQQLQ